MQTGTQRAEQPETTLETIHRRRAVRAYRPEAVDEETVRLLLDAAIHAPTAMHQEPWSFVIVQDRRTLKKISDRAKAMALEEASHRGLLEAPGANPRHGPGAALTAPDFNIFYDAGTLVVICGRASGAFVTADCWLAAENLMLAACALGLGSCPIGFAIAALNTPDIKEELGIPNNVAAIASMIVGVPSTTTPEVPRKPPEILCWLR